MTAPDILRLAPDGEFRPAFAVSVNPHPLNAEIVTVEAAFLVHPDDFRRTEDDWQRSLGKFVYSGWSPPEEEYRMPMVLD